MTRRTTDDTPHTPPELSGGGEETVDATRTFVPDGVEPANPAPIDFDERYDDRGLIGRGGMGEVRRVFDHTLDRTVAMKILGMAFIDNPPARERFALEAGVTAGLQHPGIVPVHDSGSLTDGRLWFTMREVRGRTLAQVIRSVHRVSGDSSWRATEGGWTLRRLVEALLRVSEAVAFAHREGIIHRDLKPQNIMVGAFGEVQVMDWGLAQRIGPASDGPPFDTGSAETGPMPQLGPVVGTPAYMAPEQAMGVEILTRAADVYALGGVLYETLTGSPPFVGTAQSVWRSTVEGPPMPVRKRVTPSHPPLPDELVSICDRAMAREVDARYRDAAALARALRAWLEGARRREQAEAIVADAAHLLPRARALRSRARDLRSNAETRLSVIAAHDPIERRHAAWAIQDEAADLARQATLVEIEWEQKVRSALEQAPDLESAHIRLADFYRERLEEAEAMRQREAVARFEALLRIHDRGRHAAFLRGDGALTLRTEPAGARVELLRYTEVHRRLMPQPFRTLGASPIRAVQLPPGSYLARITAPGHATVDYPVLIERGQHWDGLRPGERDPHPIRLPKEGELLPDERYVPAGWFVTGGDPEAPEGLPRRRVWVDGFVVRRFPTTRAEYLGFVNGLLADGRDDEVKRALPGALIAEGRSEVLFGRDPETGLYHLEGDQRGQDPRHPIVQISWGAAMAYADWLAETSGRPWRLPDELEREKLTRGVDGRFYPWGDDAGAPWACALDTVDWASPMYLTVDTFPTDVSPYGVRGVAGNTRDWCINIWQHDGPRVDGGRLLIEPAPLDEHEEYRAIRGGSWAANLHLARAAARFANRPHQRFAVLGVRPVRPFDLD